MAWCPVVLNTIFMRTNGSNCYYLNTISECVDMVSFTAFSFTMWYKKSPLAPNPGIKWPAILMWHLHWNYSVRRVSCPSKPYKGCQSCCIVDEKMNGTWMRDITLPHPAWLDVVPLYEHTIIIFTLDFCINNYTGISQKKMVVWQNCCFEEMSTFLRDSSIQLEWLTIFNLLHNKV